MGLTKLSCLPWTPEFDTSETLNYKISLGIYKRELEGLIWDVETQETDTPSHKQP